MHFAHLRYYFIAFIVFICFDAYVDTSSLFNLPAKYKLKIKEKERKVKVRSIAEFYEGYVRLKVAVVNETTNAIIDGFLLLNYESDALKISKVEPESMIHSENTIKVGNVKPEVKKTVAIYFDPLICTESYVDGTFAYYDHKGNKKSVEMKRRPIDIACPVFYTEEGVNITHTER